MIKFESKANHHRTTNACAALVGNTESEKKHVLSRFLFTPVLFNWRCHPGVRLQLQL